MAKYNYSIQRATNASLGEKRAKKATDNRGRIVEMETRAVPVKKREDNRGTIVQEMKRAPSIQQRLEEGFRDFTKKTKR